MKRLLLTLCMFAIVGFAELSAQGKFSGYMFGDYFYNVARDTAFTRATLPNSAVNGQKNLQGFQFRRIYFTYDNDISEQFTARFRLEADQSALSSDGKLSTFVKDAYLKWKNIFAGSDFIFGIQPTSAYEISETAWGYRSLEKTIMDLRGIVPSRHLGVSLRGKLDNGGTFNYWLTFANNQSGNKPNGTTEYADKYKRYSLMLHVKPVKTLQMTLFGEYLGSPDVNDPTSTTVPKATVSNAKTTLAAFVGYAEPERYDFGAEGFIQSTSNGMVDAGSTSGALKSLSTIGFSVWGNVLLESDLAVVARFDYFDPNSDSNVKGDARNYIIGGLSYKPNKNVSIMPNVQIETYQSAPNGGRSIDASVTGRVTFYYVFL